MTTLPTNSDAIYADDASRPGVKLHQQAHDVLAVLNNGIIDGTWTTPGYTLTPTASLPTPTLALRGKIVLIHGGTGVADEVYICRKNSAGTYEWRLLS